MLMSNTKQQIREMISDFGEDSISYGEELHTGRVKSDDEIKSDSAELLRKQTEIAEAIDRLVIEARKPYIKILKLYGTPTCDSLHHPKGYYHSALESCPVADRIAELQSQLTNKEEK